MEQHVRSRRIDASEYWLEARAAAFTFLCARPTQVAQLSVRVSQEQRHHRTDKDFKVICGRVRGLC